MHIQLPWNGLLMPIIPDKHQPKWYVKPHGISKSINKIENEETRKPALNSILYFAHGNQ